MTRIHCITNAAGEPETKKTVKIKRQKEELVCTVSLLVYLFSDRTLQIQFNNNFCYPNVTMLGMNISNGGTTGKKKMKESAMAFKFKKPSKLN